MPRPAPDRRERRRPGTGPERLRDKQRTTTSTWSRPVGVTVAYGQPGTGLVAGLIGIWSSPNKLVGTGILLAGTALDVVAIWWSRNRERERGEDVDK